MGFQFIDIIILALIAFFIFLRYRSTLGKDIGHKPDNSSQLRQQMGKQLDERVISMPGAARDVPEQEDTPPSLESEIEAENILDTDVIDGLQDIKNANESFSLSEFMSGARIAFEWVLNAFNEGDKKTLQKLMVQEVYQDFGQAIDERANAENIPHTTLVSIESAEITHVELEKKRMARITVQFTSEQIHIVKNKTGEIIEGDSSTVQKVIDEWEFERDIRSNDPAWKIIGT